MQEQIQQENDLLKAKITRAGMEEELGSDYKRCWAFAFQYATEELEFEDQTEKLCREFDLIRPQAEWFVKGASAILFKQEAKQSRQITEQPQNALTVEQRQLADFSEAKPTKPKHFENYVSQLEMMSFLEDVEEMSQDPDFMEFWEDLKTLKDKVIEQQCTTENEVLRVFHIRSIVEAKREEKERFFDAYPVSTDAWENGHFDIAGEITY
jgi:hypothetical protein